MSDRPGPAVEADAANASSVEFDEDAYMASFPKIAEAIRNGVFKSAHEHYTRRGAAENRLADPRYRRALATQLQMRALSVSGGTAAPPDGQIPSKIDTVLVASGGWTLVIGWIDDRAHELGSVSLVCANGREFTSRHIARCRRSDAEATAGCPPGTLVGFWTLIRTEMADAAAPGCNILLACGAEPISHAARPKFMASSALRDAVFEYLAGATYFGAPPVESFLQMERGVGDELLALNQAVSSSLVAGAYVERHGRQDRGFVASIVVCLYGRLEYVFLQAAFFSAAACADAYEFIYVCNSPELGEGLQREARTAAKLYGLSITLIILPGNAGFGAANNVAVRHARSDRVMMVNPDVFPRDTTWPARHAAIVGSLPAAQTRLFGAPLFYDDGSLMHGGMYFEADTGLSVRADAVVARSLLRVEHYGKGAPPDMPLYRTSRRVPAVTGAFISADRAWFERLGGFSESYVFGHYEDADLCLKAWQAGGSVWLHDIPMWHLEGKGSTRRATHEGGSVVNRWHFTKLWAETVARDFQGPDPQGIYA